MLFRTNLGTLDRAIRIAIGLAVLSLVVAGPRTLWGLFGLVPLITAAVGFCPLYTFFGLSSCPAQKLV